MSAAQFKTEHDDIWRCFYDGTCPTGEQRNWALAALAKQFPAQAALQAAKEDGWQLDHSPATEMSNETWYRRCATESAVREETLIERYSL